MPTYSFGRDTVNPQQERPGCSYGRSSMELREGLFQHGRDLVMFIGEGREQASEMKILELRRKGGTVRERVPDEVGSLCLARSSQ